MPSRSRATQPSGWYSGANPSALAIAMAAENPVGCLVLEAPFTSAVDVGAQHYWFVPVRLLMKDQFRSDLWIGKVRAPVLVVHGESDTVVPISLGECLYGLARMPKRFVRVAGAGHNDLGVTQLPRRNGLSPSNPRCDGNHRLRRVMGPAGATYPAGRLAAPDRSSDITSSSDSPREGLTRLSMNYLRTVVLLAGLTGLFMAVGYLIGGAGGAVIALIIAAATNLFSYWNSDRLVLSMHNAQEAYFGHPQAHEHDIESAVRGGLTLVEAVTKLDCGSTGPLQLRVGIATGPVVIGDLLGNGADQHGIIGEAAQLAGSLERVAEPNSVVIAASTRQLVGNLFDCNDLGRMTLNGFSEPIPAWRVLGPSGIDSRFEALRTATTPLIGRDEELELLLRRWRQSAHGEGRVVLLSGEPGIGKSRLAVELQKQLQSELHTHQRHFCSPHHQDSALYPIISQLQQAAGFRRDDTDQQRLNKLEAVLVQSSNNLEDVAPLIADLLSVSSGNRYPPLDLTPQKRKEKMLRALLAQLEGLGEPVLTVFEDVHWIDPTLLELLDLMVDRVPTLPVLLVITFRPEFAPPWIGRPHVTLLTLSPAATPECRDDRRGDRWQGIAQGYRGPDHRSHRRRTAIH